MNDECETLTAAVMMTIPTIFSSTIFIPSSMNNSALLNVIIKDERLDLIQCAVVTSISFYNRISIARTL